MNPSLPGRTSSATAGRPRNAGTTRLLLIVVVLLIVYGLARGLFGHHQNTYERIAFGMTQALQQNDLAAVQKYQNAETATLVTHAIVGRDADAFAPLGKLKDVRETSADSSQRVHSFDAAFDKGVVKEQIRFDPDNKVVGFRYDLPAGQ